MADIDITIVTDIEGLDELEEAFTQGSKRAVKKFLARVQREAADVLVKSAEENAPYLDGYLSERIRKMTVVGGGAVTTRVGPGKDAFWGMFQEFGAPEANIIGTHWLEQSAKEVQTEVLEEYYEGLREGLEDMKK
jgi:Bacteriophage HK97-gp10, putative tail-component